MSYPIPVPDHVEKILTTCSNEELAALRAQVFNSRDVPQEAAVAISQLIGYELALREQEPLWRKASRFYKRHSGEINGVAKLAAVCIAAFGGAATYDMFDND